ncbi:MAG TPA: hypothetical protein DCK93_14080 [Blastocatellia bacterium]|nr:hypothetical protein [Blastocatellia bacterium]
MKRLKLFLAAAFCLVVMSSAIRAQVPILYYDFENNTTRTIFENAVEQAVNSGSGAITRAGGSTTVSSVAGAGTFNGGAAAGQAATGTTWDSSTTDPGATATNYYQFIVNIAGFSQLSITFDQQASGTGPARVGVLYSTDGSTFTASTTSLTGNAVFAASTFDLSSITAIDNQSSVTIRIYAFAGSAGDRTGRSAFASGGTFRIDNLTVLAKTAAASKTLLDYPAIGLSIKSGTVFNPTYTDFALNGSGITVSLAANLNLGGTLTLTSGDLDTGSNTLTMPATATSAGTTDVIGNVLRTGFVTGGSALSFGNPFNTIAITSGTAPANILVNLVKGSPADFANAVRRTYTITPSAGGFTGTLQVHYNDSELNGNTESSLVLWRNVSSVWASQGGTVTDDTVSDNNFVQLAGVTQFSRWTIAGPSAPTAVRLTQFNAASYADGVQLSWESGFEVNNLGYHLYREQNGQRTRVTPSVVAGSALTVGQGNRLTAGYSYSWFDPQGTPDTTYYLEAIDLNGSRQWTGPIYPYAGAGQMLSPKRQRATLLSELGSSLANKRAATNAAGWPAAMKAEARRESLRLNPQSLAVQQAIAGGKAVKIQVRHSGWYRLTQGELVAAGFDPATDARLLQLFVDGEEVPIGLSSNGARLNANDTLEFYGVGMDTPTTDTRTYWLINGSSAGKRVSAKRAKITPGDENWTQVSGPRSFVYTTERRDKLTYSPRLLNGDAENIFGAIIFTDPIDQALSIKNFDRESAAQPQLEVDLQGLTAQEHEVRVQLNGTDVGTLTFSGSEHPAAKFAISRALLREGDNTVSLASQNGDADISFVDSIRLSYAHAYTADNNALTFSLPSGQVVKVDGFTTPNVRVVDITNPASPLELTTTAGPSGTGYAVRVQAMEGDVRTLLAFTDDLADRPSSVTANKPSSWHASTNGADLVIITHQDFRQAIEPLANLRRSQGMNVAVVDVEDVYDEFSCGAHTPAALKDFLSGAASHWRRKPGYLLLVGDSSWDPRNYLDQGDNDFVPTKLIDTSFMETASDDWLVDFTGLGQPDMALGRLPGRTAAEVSLMVTKIMSYEQERELNVPLRGAILVADNGFESKSSQMQALLPAGVAVQTINRAQVGNDDVMRGQIVDALNQGPMIVNYYGHGSVRVWTGAGVLDSDLADKLTNANKPSVYVMMTCLNGYAHDAFIDSLSESLLKAPGGGAVAVWASSGFTASEPQFVMNSQFYRLLFGSQPLRLGEAVRGSKTATSDLDVRRTWMLLGDPAMRIR